MQGSFDCAVGVGLFHAAFTGNAGDCRNEWNPSVGRFNIVKALKKRRVRPLADATDMAANMTAPREYGAIWSCQILFECRLEAVPLTSCAGA